MTTISSRPEVRTPRIFYVEDNPGDIELVRLSFEDFGRKVLFETAIDGSIAMRRLTNASKEGSFDFDLIILDINLPICSGVQLLAFIKADHVLRKIPTVMLTSTETTGEKMRCLDLHADAFLVKPLAYDGYESIIAELSKFLV